MKILMIVAPNFRDAEFQKPFNIFKKNNIPVDITSFKVGNIMGADGMALNVNKDFYDIEISDYTAVVVIGGPGSSKLVGVHKLDTILKKAIEKNIVVASICFAGVVLAKAGILNNKKATVWNGNGKQKQILEDNGAIYIDKPVVVDVKIVTANGPDAAEEFGNTILNLIK